MEENKIYYRCLLLFYFRKGKKAAYAHRKLTDVYGEDAISERACQKWFSRFRDGDTTLEDEERSGRPSVADDEQILALISSNTKYTTREISDQLNISYSSVVRHLHQLGYVNRDAVWVLNELTEKKAKTNTTRKRKNSER